MNLDPTYSYYLYWSLAADNLALPARTSSEGLVNETDNGQISTNAELVRENNVHLVLEVRLRVSIATL